MTDEFKQREAEFMKGLRALMAKYHVDIISLVHIVDTNESAKEDKPAIAVENN